MPVRAPLRPGQQTPLRPVPPHITRPEYVGKPAPTRKPLLNRLLRSNASRATVKRKPG